MTFKQRLAGARSRYLAHPGRKALRAYLVLKAKTGVWDARYCRYYAVPSSGLTPWVRAFLTRGVAAGLVPTATTNGKHSATSYHEDGRAGDLGLVESLVGTKTGRKRLERFQGAEYSRRHRLGHTELLGPVNGLCVLRGRPVTLAEGAALEDMHDDHVHGARAER